MKHDELVYWVKRAQAGSGEAVGKLYESFRDEVYSIALSETHNKALSEDIVQEIFEEVIRTIDTVREPSAFPAWLKKLAYHQCTRYYKRKETRHEILLDDTECITFFDNLSEDRREYLPDDSFDQKELREVFLKMLDELPDAQSAALRMFYYEEMSLKEIAAVQDVPVNTANTRLNRGRMAVKHSIEEYEKKHGVRLHVFAFLPFFKWLLADTNVQMPTEAAARVAKNIATKTAIKIGAAGTAHAVTGNGAASAAVHTGGVSLSAKITAGVAAVVMAVSIPVAVKLTNTEIESPEIIMAAAQGVQTSPTETVIDTEPAHEVITDPHSAYEDILRAGVTQNGLTINYFAFLDLEGDGVDELIAADQNGTPETMTECEVYTFRDNCVVYLGYAGAYWDYLYHVNNKYLCGSSMKGRIYLAADGFFSLSSNHWNEDMTRNDPAISYDGGQWAYITQEEFDYYNSNPMSGDSEYIQSAEIITLSKNPYREKNILEKTLDFSKAWATYEDYDGQRLCICYVFEKNGVIYCAAGPDLSEWAAFYTGTYSVEDDVIFISLDAPSGMIEYAYQFDPDGMMLTQVSETGLVYGDAMGTALKLEEFVWKDAQAIKELVQSGIAFE